jgi:hypothetical protein
VGEPVPFDGFSRIVFEPAVTGIVRNPLKTVVDDVFGDMLRVAVLLVRSTHFSSTISNPRIEQSLCRCTSEAKSFPVHAS